jgi:hypothetical protein
MSCPKVPKESYQDRAIRARQQYVDRVDPNDIPLKVNPPVATSGR